MISRTQNTRPCASIMRYSAGYVWPGRVAWREISSARARSSGWT